MSRLPLLFALLSTLLLLLLVANVAGASVIYDFTTPAAEATLSGAQAGVLEAGAIPLVVEAGLLDHDGNFTPGGENATLSVRLVPELFSPGAGLGVLSNFPSGSFPDDGLSMEEGLVFHFSPLFAPRFLHLDGITLGGFEDGGTFEAVRVFVNGQYLLDRKGEPDATLTIALPPGVSTLAVMPLLQVTQEISDLSSDPVFFVAAIEGEAAAVEVALDLKPGSCTNVLNTKSKGMFPAAILGTQTLNVANIDPASIRVAGVAPLRVTIEDVGQTGRCTTGRDGIPDLLLKLDTQALVQALRASLGTLHDGQRIVVPLEGTLRDGTPLIGDDVVVIQVPGKK
jgi:hypothetical protein